MKLRKVRLQNYRNHVDTELALEGVTFAIVRGPNAAGKSSIGQGLSMSLAETTMGLQNDGSGFRSKIKDQEKQAVVTTEIQGQHILEKKVSLNLSATGRVSAVKCIDTPDDSKVVKGFENFLSRYQDALKISLNTDFFTRMDEKGQKNLLAKLVLPSRYDFPNDKVDAVNGLLDTAIDFNGEPFSVIELAYKKLYKERESINRDVKNFVIPDALPIPKGVDSESLQKQLVETRSERAKLQKERDEAVAKANEVEVKRATLQTKITHLRAELDKGKEQLEVLTKEIIPEDGLAALQKVAGKAAELAELRKSRSTYLGGVRAVNEQIERLRSISDKGVTCPTCDQDIDSAKIEGLIADLKKEIAEADKNIQAIDKKIESIGDCAAASAAIEKHQKAVKEKEALTISLTETVTQGKKTRADLDALTPKQDATLPFNDPLGTLQAKEDKIIEQLTPVITAEQRAKDIKEKKAKFEKLEEKAKTLQELVTYFDKDGIKKTLIGQFIGGFENKLNSVLGAWGYKASLSSDLSSFDVETPRGYKGPVKELSGAEEHIFKCAFQCAVSSAAGIKLVVIDEIEEIGIEIRQNLYLSVFQLIQSGALEQAILIGYSLDKTVPDPKAPGSRYYFVENGEVEVLG